MEIITSVKNDLISKVRRIKEEPTNKLFLENPKLIEEAYKAKKNIDYVLIQDDKMESLLCSFPFLQGQKIHLVKENVIKHLCDTKSPQGVIAIVNFDIKEPIAPRNNFIVLDNLQDPGNLGTIIRSAKGTNFLDIYLINSVNYLNQKVVRSAMGNIFDVNLYSFKDTNQFVNFANNNKLNLYVADMNGQNLFEIKHQLSSVGIVIGNEGRGVSNEIKELAKNKISIPMKNGLESLNAGVSCSIIIYYFDNLK